MFDSLWPHGLPIPYRLMLFSFLVPSLKFAGQRNHTVVHFCVWVISLSLMFWGLFTFVSVVHSFLFSLHSNIPLSTPDIGDFCSTFIFVTVLQWFFKISFTSLWVFHEELLLSFILSVTYLLPNLISFFRCLMNIWEV